MTGKDNKNPLFNYIKEIDKKKVSPWSFGLVHRKSKKEINIRSFYLNDTYVDAFIKGIQHSKNIKILNLSRNNLTTNRLIKIIQMLPKTLSEFNIGNNPNLSIEAFKTLSETLLDSR